MKSIIVIIAISLAAIVAILFSRQNANITSSIQKPPSPTPTTKPLLKYEYENLRKYNSQGSKISMDRELKSEELFTSYIFFFSTKDGKKVSGLMNVPTKKGNYPVMLLVRGFVDPNNYATGIGSSRVGEYFAQNGFVTVAPDFLGYGESDKPSDDAFEDRFLTYTTVIDLLASIKNLNDSFSEKSLNGITVDHTKVGIWGHSNGGQIALSVAEITGTKAPVVVWAPVSKPFPYSILYYTDEFDDLGKALRKALANFEQNYDVEKYSMTNFLDLIQAPVQIHQGEADEAIPTVWSESLRDSLTKLDKDVEYFSYPGENHNFQNWSWPRAVSRSLEFVNKNLK